MTTPPSTGVVELDQALAQLIDVDQHPVAEQYARLSRAQEHLQRTLHGTGPSVGASPPAEAVGPRPR